MNEKLEQVMEYDDFRYDFLKKKDSKGNTIGSEEKKANSKKKKVKNYI